VANGLPCQLTAYLIRAVRRHPVMRCGGWYRVLPAALRPGAIRRDHAGERRHPEAIAAVRAKLGSTGRWSSSSSVWLWA
jgi:hypothetical protein